MSDARASSSILEPPLSLSEVEVGEIKSWRGPDGGATLSGDPSRRRDSLKDATGAVSRLAAKLKEGAAVVERQAQEKRALLDAATKLDAQQAQRQAALAARANAAEQQLAGTHEVLQETQRAQREASATAAELREKLKEVAAERDAAVRRSDNAARQLQEASDHAARAVSERDAARRELQAAQNQAAASEARLRQAQLLEDGVRQREREVGERVSAVEVEAVRLREAAREAERREVDAELRLRRLEAR